MKQQRFKHLPHTSEFKVRVWGRDLGELFAHALYALAQTIKERLPRALDVEREVTLEARDTELLLADFLQEVVFLVDVHREVYPEVHFTEISPTRLSAVLKGAKVENFDEEIKGVALHGLKVVRKKDNWVAEVVFDV